MKARILKNRSENNFSYFVYRMIGLEEAIVKSNGVKHFLGFVNNKNDAFEPISVFFKDIHEQITEARARELAPHLFK